jgi:hypothetical protein
MNEEGRLNLGVSVGGKLQARSSISQELDSGTNDQYF